MRRVFWGFVLLVLLHRFGAEVATYGANYTADDGSGRVNHFADADFSRGFRLWGIPAALQPPTELGLLTLSANRENTPNRANTPDESPPLPDTQNPPFWTLATHYSRWNLATAKVCETADGERFVETPGSRVGIRNDGEGAILRLDVYADAEYDRPRKTDEPWPHLLISHDFSPDKALRLDGDSVIFSFDVRIGPWEDCMTPDQYDPHRHCAQTTAYFVLQNANPKSSDFHEYIWFGIPIFDSRYEQVEPYLALDGDPKVLGTGKLIDTLGGPSAYDRIYGGKNPRNGEWCHGEIDLSAELATALAEAKSRGLLTATKPSDIRLNHFNLGWEVPGTFRCAIHLKNIFLFPTAANRE